MPVRVGRRRTAKEKRRRENDGERKLREERCFFRSRERTVKKKRKVKSSKTAIKYLKSGAAKKIILR